MHAGVWASPYDWYLTQDRFAPVHVMRQRGVLQPMRGRDKDAVGGNLKNPCLFPGRAGAKLFIAHHNLTDHWQIRAKY
jgi:hypothetical protein